jgi:hypothetical protein
MQGAPIHQYTNKIANYDIRYPERATYKLLER